MSILAPVGYLSISCQTLTPCHANDFIASQEFCEAGRGQAVSDNGKAIKFIVLSTQRSGSSFLCASLDAHPRIACREELFMPKNKNDITYRSYRTGSLKRKVGHLFARRNLVYSYLEGIYSDDAVVDALGFKFMYGQARRYPAVIDWCKEFDVNVIHLIRRNTLKMIVSRHVARKRGIYLSTKQLRPVTVKLDTSSLISEIRKLETMTEINGRSFSAMPYMEVFYEDFVVNYDEESRRMLDFLGADEDEQLTSDLKKTSADSLDALIENYEEVCQALAGSPYEQYLA